MSMEATSKRISKLSIKNLESYLQDLSDFERPKLNLEQYATPPHIAALMLNTIDQSFNDLNGKFVADLGCGTGRLTIGSLLCGASMVFGFDIDQTALTIALDNVKNLFTDQDDNNDDKSDSIEAYKHCQRLNLVQVDLNASLEDVDSRYDCLMLNKFDTVIMNPPFGTKQSNQGLDMLFLQRAISMTDNVVYSLHKTSTRNYILNKCQQWGVEKAKPIGQIRYNLDNTYKFHRKKSVDIDVDLWQIKVT